MGSLRRKALAVLLAGFALGCGLLMLLTGALLKRDYTRLEEQLAREDAARLHRAVERQLLGLTRTALDWSVWDETRDFILTGNPRYVAANLGDASFANLGVSLMIFADRKGRVVHTGRRDRYPAPTGEEAARLVGTGAPGSPGLATTPDGAAYGIARTAQGPLLFASSAVLRSDGTGEPAGTLFVGKALDEEQVGLLAQAVGLAVRIQPAGSPRTPPAAAGGGDAATVRPLGDERLIIDTSFPPVDGSEPFVARIEKDRDLHAQGRRAIRLSVGSIAFGGVTVLVLMSLFLDRLVLRRLAQLTREVGAITASGDVSRRIAGFGGDEIGRLGEATNGMLASLERGEGALRDSRQALAARLGELEAAAARIDRLQKLLPICARCKKVRSDGNYWHQIEHYLGENAAMTFSHGVCPECAEDFRRSLTPPSPPPTIGEGCLGRSPSAAQTRGKGVDP